jgi:hypothetical protein
LWWRLAAWARHDHDSIGGTRIGGPVVLETHSGPVRRIILVPQAPRCRGWRSLKSDRRRSRRMKENVARRPNWLHYRPGTNPNLISSSIGPGPTASCGRLTRLQLNCAPYRLVPDSTANRPLSSFIPLTTDSLRSLPLPGSSQKTATAMDLITAIGASQRNCCQH